MNTVSLQTSDKANLSSLILEPNQIFAWVNLEGLERIIINFFNNLDDILSYSVNISCIEDRKLKTKMSIK